MRIVRIGAAFALVLTIAACGDDATTTTAPPASTTTLGVPPPTTTEATTSTTQAPSTTEATTTTMATGGRALTTVADPDLGEILVDQDGRTLYLFLPDDQGTPTCTGSCIGTWPPFEDDDVSAGNGIEAALLGSVERDDGSLQVTYNGWPLYYFAPDGSPGDANGQGIGGNWWVVSPAGDAIMG